MHRFVGNSDGSVAVMAALCFVVITAVVGVAIDYGRAHRARSNAQKAVDAGVLVAVGQENEGNAQAAFSRYLQSNLPVGSSMPSTSLTLTQTANGVNADAAGAFDLPTTFLSVIGIDSIRIGTKSSAFAPNAPTQIILQPREVYGWSNTVVDFWARRPDGTEEVFASVAYNVTDRTGAASRGTGTTVTTPASTNIAVGPFTKLWVTLKVTPYDSNQPVVYSSEDPAAAVHFFVNDKQLGSSQQASLDARFPCGTTAHYALEDSTQDVGGPEWSLQDQFFDLTTTCERPNFSSARLTH